jgi:hypothetical protein
VAEHREAELPHVARARGSTGGFAGTLHGRQEQSDEHCDDRDHDQQLDERETM